MYGSKSGSEEEPENSFAKDGVESFSSAVTAEGGELTGGEAMLGGEGDPLPVLKGHREEEGDLLVLEEYQGGGEDLLLLLEEDLLLLLKGQGKGNHLLVLEGGGEGDLLHGDRCFVLVGSVFVVCLNGLI